MMAVGTLKYSMTKALLYILQEFVAQKREPAAKLNVGSIGRIDIPTTKIERKQTMNEALRFYWHLRHNMGYSPQNALNSTLVNYCPTFKEYKRRADRLNKWRKGTIDINRHWITNK